ncbi:CPBP family intramembrane metalloprotease [Fulvivirga sp. M361]|uniref:CPBP family intramembrane glutamic endopeptidase n=1 Tax=Fulvivirga sp. M361 TaxID=2594266 RepID=UPI00117BA6E6|nr:CPBP family intramembrane glutamic endopeptidase [Fulvivirga sp. M361]TRX60605.1 CPBP family intramembrane metalloprotease [Fulvivirga sp. M361]
MDIAILLTYGFLLLAAITVWFYIKLFRKTHLWLVFAGVSFVLAIFFERATLFSFGYVLFLGCITYYYFKVKHIVLFLLLVLFSVPLLLHFPALGFHNYKYLDKVIVSDGASPYSLYLNLDKAMIGIFIIGFGLQERKPISIALIKRVVINLLLMCTLFLFLTMLLGYTRFEPKLPYFTPVWVFTNLFFTCMAEEALFRKLIQQKIYASLTFKYRSQISVLIASVIFGLAHFNGGPIYVILSTLAGLFYGHIYFKTNRTESAILLHFTFNLVHLLLFTYPSLS